MYVQELTFLVVVVGLVTPSEPIETKRNFLDKHSKEDALVTFAYSAQLLLSVAAPVLASRSGTVHSCKFSCR